jgi:glycosyltransferase involved in cell wall biosynthesis
VRIAHVTDFYLTRVGGIERQVHQLAQRQARSAHQVHVVTSTRGPDTSGVDLLRVHRLGSPRIPHAGPVSPRAWVALPGVLDEIDPDVVHIHASVGSPLALLAGLSWGGSRRPTVVSVHSMWAHLARPYRAIFTATGLLRLPIVWTAVSRAAARQVQSAVGPAQHVRVLPNGIDPDGWRRPSTKPRPDVHVVAVLRLTARKRPLALLKVLRRARETLPADVRMRASVIGDGRQRWAAERYLTRHGMTWVNLLGTRSQAQVRDALHDADVFLATARLESFGIAALEARCAGVPVIALAQTGVADFVRHGREGLLAADDDDLVASLVRLAGSPDARAAIAAHNRDRLPSVSWAVTLAAAEQAYEDAAALLGASRAAPVARTG